MTPRHGSGRRPRIRAGVFPAVMLAALAACAGGAPDERIPAATQAPNEPALPAAPLAAALPESAPPPAPSPAVLRGLSGDEVTRLIGPPRFRRAEDPSALWRYGANGCVLDIYFRADGPLYRVVHFEFRPDPKNRPAGAQAAGPLGVDATACFAGMVRVQPGAPG